MPNPTAITSNGQHNTSTFATVASSKPSFHAKTDNIFCTVAPTAAIHPSVAAPEPFQKFATCPIKSQDSTANTRVPTQKIVRPVLAFAPIAFSLTIFVVCTCITPPAQPLRPCKPRLEGTSIPPRGQFGQNAPSTGERSQSRDIQNPHFAFVPANLAHISVSNIQD